MFPQHDYLVFVFTNLNTNYFITFFCSYYFSFAFLIFEVIAVYIFHSARRDIRVFPVLISVRFSQANIQPFTETI